MDLELVQAVKRVAANECVLDPRLGSLAAQPEAPSGLTTRELEVLQFIVNGKSNKEIATVLGVSANTVAVHRANIMQALGHPQHGRTGGVRHSAGSGEHSVTRRSLLPRRWRGWAGRCSRRRRHWAFR